MRLHPKCDATSASNITCEAISREKKVAMSTTMEGGNGTAAQAGGTVGIGLDLSALRFSLHLKTSGNVLGALVDELHVRCSMLST